jgi:hypothetical protein
MPDTYATKFNNGTIIGISLYKYNNKNFEGNLLGILTATINLEETFLVEHSPAWM